MANRGQQVITLSAAQLNDLTSGAQVIQLDDNQAQTVTVQVGGGDPQVIQLNGGAGQQQIVVMNQQQQQQQNEEEEEEEPFYVNAKQYNRILKRRQQRARLEELGLIKKERSKYMHESRHKHAVARVRSTDGKFGHGSPAKMKAEEAAMSAAIQQQHQSSLAEAPFYHHQQLSMSDLAPTQQQVVADAL